MESSEQHQGLPMSCLRSLQALLTTQLLSHIWKEQKDFRTKILSPWPLDGFAIGEFVTWNRISHYNQGFFSLSNEPSIDQGFMGSSVF